MYLKKIHLTNFRNYPNLDFKFNKQITIFIGDNAQGKTNLLESIYFIATAKSFKGLKDEEIVKYDQDVLRVEGELDNRVKLEVVFQKQDEGIKKRIRVNGIAKRLVDYSGNLAVVEFLPEDINLVTSPPSLRREHMDAIISQADRSYKKLISSYEEVVTNKNKVLKRIRERLSRKDELIFWSDQQIILGAKVSIKREEFFNFINQTQKKMGNFKFEFKESLLNRDRLEEYQQREIDAAVSLIGPHRDDFTFLLDGQDLAKYGSRGEQRTAVLDLKLAEVEFIEKSLDFRPILLLDDIFSELDDIHQEHVIDVSKLQQTIITAVELDEHIKKQLGLNIAVFRVGEGIEKVA